MRSLTTDMPKGEARTAAAQDELTRAYRDFFTTRNGQLVLADLGEYTGWNRVCDPSVAGAVLIDHNARRAVFGRIFHFLNLTREEREGLDEAIRREQIASKNEGTI